MKRIHDAVNALGSAGVIGIGVLIFCIPLYFSAVRPAERELQAQRSVAERLNARTPFQPVSSSGRAEELRRFYGLFPPLEKLPDQLERVYGFARSANLELLQGEYRLEIPRVGMPAYRITLPIRGSYAQIRQFVGTTLKDMPSASLDALRFERKRIGDPQLEAQVRMTVYFRPVREGDTP
ncbi:MAG TPA: hypothetical protein VIW78_14230 [Burkholderiales bacterium]